MLLVLVPTISSAGTGVASDEMGVVQNVPVSGEMTPVLFRPYLYQVR